jgi:hypothetical protein
VRGRDEEFVHKWTHTSASQPESVHGTLDNGVGPFLAMNTGTVTAGWAARFSAPLDRARSRREWADQRIVGPKRIVIPFLLSLFSRFKSSAQIQILFRIFRFPNSNIVLMLLSILPFNIYFSICFSFLLFNCGRHNDFFYYYFHSQFSILCFYLKLEIKFMFFSIECITKILSSSDQPFFIYLLVI